jgi:hypothetical protein
VTLLSAEEISTSEIGVTVPGVGGFGNGSYCFLADFFAVTLFEDWD